MTYKYKKKRKKIDRSNTTLYGHKPVSKTRKIVALVITIIFAILLVFFGYCIGEPIYNYIKNPPETNPNAWTPPEVTNITTEETLPTSDMIPVSFQEWSAYTLKPVDMLNKELFESAVESAKDSGYTSVVVPLKTQGGEMYYATKVNVALLNGEIVKSELPLDEISKTIKRSGLMPIASVSVLYDNLSPVNETDIGFKIEESGILWYDDYINVGGKPWISPFSSSSQNYLSQISDEIGASGFDAVLISDIAFPEFEEADFSEIGDIIRNEELRGTVLYETASLFSDCAPFTMYRTSASEIVNDKDEFLEKTDYMPPFTAVAVEFDYDTIENKLIYNDEEFTLSEMNIYERTKIISGFVSSEFSGIELIPVISSKKMMAGDVDEAIRALSELGYTKYIIE